MIDLSGQADVEFKPNLHDIHRVLNEEVVGEHESRLSLFTNWVLSNQNVLMSGPRSSGKTWITDHVCPFLGDNTFTVSSGSDKSTWYQMEAIKKCTHVIILELNKCPKDFLETLKDWGEGKDSTYKNTVMDAGERRIKSFKLPRKPYVFCLADEDVTKVGEQLMSRLTNIRTDNSVSQNRAVLLHQAKLAKEQNNVKKVDSELKKKLQYHVQTLPLFETYEYKHPAAETFVEVIPKMFTDCRRDFPKYLGNTYGIARFHWKQRITVDSNKKKFLFITPEDMYLNHEIYGQALIESALKCSGMQREMIKIVEKHESTNKNFVQNDLRKIGIIVSAHMVTKHLNSLADLGYIGKMKDGSTNVYTKNEQEEFRFSIDWDDVVEQSKKTIEKLYPSIASEYIAAFCTNPIVVHPFTGKEINLMEQKSIPKQPKRDTLEFFQNQTQPSAVEEEVVG